MTKRQRLDRWLDEREATALVMDGFDEAILGVAQIFTRYIVIYDRARCLAILQTRDGMDADEAEEFFEFNCQGAYMGEETPGVLVWSCGDVQ